MIKWIKTWWSNLQSRKNNSLNLQKEHEIFHRKVEEAVSTYPVPDAVAPRKKTKKHKHHNLGTYYDDRLARVSQVQPVPHTPREQDTSFPTVDVWAAMTIYDAVRPTEGLGLPQEAQEAPYSGLGGTFDGAGASGDWDSSSNASDSSCSSSDSSSSSSDSCSSDSSSSTD